MVSPSPEAITVCRNLDSRCFGYLKSRGAKSFRQRRQVSHSCAVPADSKYTFLIPAFVSSSLKVFVPGPSTEPIPRNRTFIFLLNAAASAKTPLLAVFGSNPPRPPLLPL